MNTILESLSGTAITEFQSQQLPSWDDEKITQQQQNFMLLVEKNHFYNYSLWKEEDKARRDDKGFEHVYLAKRKIDKHNQNRNNMMEAMDDWIIRELEPAQSNCQFHTETPGMIIDRLSILNLKKYHMHIQANRNDADQGHLKTCNEKYQTLCQQLAHLSTLLDDFLADIKTKKRSFRVYKQFKMYNDPSLNPELYNARE